MEAVKIYVDEINSYKLGCIAEQFNSYEDLAAIMIDARTIFISGAGPCAIKWAETVIATEYDGEYSVEIVK